ncbi:MAG TPA: helix-turn-helix domain-containing protein [Beutenbergiaceae bacterium]|nr:helix-turn-helix domain-containing protein [Beutenbergiaceae bacterium]
MGVVKTSQLGRDHEPVCHDTHRRDVASILFNLPGYRVISAWYDDQGQRVVMIETAASEDGCPSRGVMSSRVHSRPVQQVKDLPCGGGRLTVRVRKRRYVCAETVCPRRMFTEVTDELPARARLTTRLAAAVVDALRCEPRAVAGVAGQHAVSWTTVMRLATSTIDVEGHADFRHVRHLGIDEHRFRRVRFVRDAHTGTTTRVEPWSIVFTDLGTGAILDVVDGRCGATVRNWIKARPVGDVGLAAR